ncbi:MAG TPA: homoserine kinase [Vicinamibacterales bacterium]
MTLLSPMTDRTRVPVRAGTEIVVPASVANLGPGFDAMSVAVNLYLRLTVVDLDPSRRDGVDWEFTGAAPAGENRIDSAFRLARARGEAATPSVRVRVESDIPQAAGLGSSAAATVAGLRLYEALTAPRADCLTLASELEGHPDNAAAALLGGLTISCQREDGRIIARSSRWPEDVKLVVATPDMGLQTSHARGVLPKTIPLADAIFNLQRALLFVRALESGRYDDVREAMKDRWHQPARAALVPGLAEAMALDDSSILGVCLSGAGPSVVALSAHDTPRAAAMLDDLYKRLGVPCTIRTLSAHQPGH